jgi:IclR helix-turn-helix domain
VREGALDVTEREVVIELSPAQVDKVVRQAAKAGNMSVVLSGLDDLRGTLETRPWQLTDQRLSRSLLSGLLMLAAFPADGGYLGNADLARSLGMNLSTAHRYIQTLLAVGLIERHPSTRKYRLAQ